MIQNTWYSPSKQIIWLGCGRTREESEEKRERERREEDVVVYLSLETGLMMRLASRIPTTVMLQAQPGVICLSRILYLLRDSDTSFRTTTITRQALLALSFSLPRWSIGRLRLGSAHRVDALLVEYPKYPSSSASSGKKTREGEGDGERERVLSSQLTIITLSAYIWKRGLTSRINRIYCTLQSISPLFTLPLTHLTKIIDCVLKYLLNHGGKSIII